MNWLKYELHTTTHDAPIIGNLLCSMGIEGYEIKDHVPLTEKEEKLMRCAFSTMNLTARTYHKVLKVARTIADLDGEEQIGCSHLKEALGYRMLDKKYWGR